MVLGGGGAAVVLGALQCRRPRRPGTPDGVLTELVRSEVEASSSSNVTALWLGQLRTHVDVSRQTVDDNPDNIEDRQMSATLPAFSYLIKPTTFSLRASGSEKLYL